MVYFLSAQLGIPPRDIREWDFRDALNVLYTIMFLREEEWRYARRIQNKHRL